MNGGSEPHHLYSCGLGAMARQRIDIVIMHYNEAKGGAVFEKVIRALLTLPQTPVLLYISHCTMGDFSTFPDFRRNPGAIKLRDEPPGYFEVVRPVEERTARHYELPFVSTCAAFHTMMSRVDQTARVHPAPA